MVLLLFFIVIVEKHRAVASDPASSSSVCKLFRWGQCICIRFLLLLSMAWVVWLVVEVNE